MNFDIVNQRDENQIFARCVPLRKLEDTLAKVRANHPRVDAFTIQSNLFDGPKLQDKTMSMFDGVIDRKEVDSD